MTQDNSRGHKVDKCIEQHHGISCCVRIGSPNYEEGVFVLHFCDVLTIKLCEVQGKDKPDVLVRSPSFNTLNSDLVDSIFKDVFNDGSAFTVEERMFVIANASLFYYIYGFWHNYSNKAIRLSFASIDNNPRAVQLATDDIFLRCQVAKHDQLNRRAQGLMVRNLYLLD